MNEEKKKNIPQKNKKPSADGLSKKERRALKVAQKSGETVSNHIDNRKNIAKITSNKDVEAVDKKVVEQVKSNEKVEIKVNSNVESKSCSPTLQNKQGITESTHNNIENTVPSITPSKAQLRAERRALQEIQRLAKALEKSENIKPEVKESPKALVKISTKKIDLKLDTQNEHRVDLLNHLYFNKSFVGDAEEISNELHPSFIRLGVQYSSKTILGSNARCLALLNALIDFTEDFSTPTNQEFCRSFESYLQKNELYLKKCRPFAVSMTNALKDFKICLTQIDTNLSDMEKRKKLLEMIDTYKRDQIGKAGEAISMNVKAKITNKDVILTYGCSSVVRQLLLDAHQDGKQFKVIIVDSRPLLEGREMLRSLIIKGIDCTYCLINSVSFIMRNATKVLLGAHALLANGYVMSRTGTAQVALIAQNFNKPVLVCCETYKFCERVQTDCFVYNEIGDADKLVNIDTLGKESPLANWRDIKYLQPLNLLYDITPPDFITAVVTELGYLPCTSVPVVLRIKPTE